MIVDGHKVDHEGSATHHTGNESSAEKHLLDPFLSAKLQVHGATKVAIDRGSGSIHQNGGIHDRASSVGIQHKTT